jgi:hypothetical protein
MRARLLLVAATLALCSAPTPLRAAGDEIQVYLDDLSAPGEIGLDLHLNFVLAGRATPDWPGELPPRHVFLATPEFGFGVTRWLELGLYLPAAAGRGDVYGNGVKVRAKLVPPRGAGARFFWGVNVELGRVARRVSEERWTVELRPILGWRAGRWLLAANPILGFALGAPRSAQGGIEPAVKVGFSARRALMLGVEHYAVLGTLADIAAARTQEHVSYAVVDYEGHGLNLNVGLGRGWPSGSDHWVAKAIVGLRLR